ncbi:uncharacterized protein LOC118181135 [Stegodyphus dumicola]|uniref:uncharacterized protein LOC118181135 n=1 Tax=Stegodyphus dumicola TaxID=202533 RepID=UPI0015AA7535|nr:uncharacterized protein LOC118181135 [Stegodyphus dumicola]XP_035206099.1 uncharacterized protein LOC118181135 [Stegodyphus dumicola]
MEVLENNNHLKEAEPQPSGSGYGCRQDSNLRTSAVPKNKSETDVNLLVACKVQLSYEVVRWKTESLRLQKERDAARQKAKELDLAISKLSERTRELEGRLSSAEGENQKLRTKSTSVEEENVSLMRKISQSFNSYHSFPWAGGSSKPLFLSRHESVVKKDADPPQEDWKEVSQKLLEQMKQEMRELQEFSSQFSEQENGNSDINIAEDENSSNYGELEEILSSLVTNTRSLKHHLLEQRRKLQFLVSSIDPGETQSMQINPKTSAGSLQTLTNQDASICFTKNKASSNNFPRPSDESCRVYFTKQLGGQQGLDKAVEQILKNDNIQHTRNDLNAGSHEQHTDAKFLTLQPDTTSDQETLIAEEDRVCPICQAPFGVVISQKEFEEHVLDHLEVESASLLDQYVVL